MSSLNNTKILVLLVALMLYVNYQNYMKGDVVKLHREIATLQTNIEREKNIAEGNYTKEALKLSYDELLFDGKLFNYSTAMGKMQEIIHEAAKENCDIKYIKWAQASLTKTWYDKLRMDLSLDCEPQKFFVFVDELQKHKILYIAENSTILRYNNQSKLNIRMQFITFRKKDESN